MKVGTLCQHEVMTAGPEDSLAEVASRMQYNEVGALAVFEDGNLIAVGGLTLLALAIYQAPEIVRKVRGSIEDFRTSRSGARVAPPA